MLYLYIFIHLFLTFLIMKLKQCDIFAHLSNVLYVITGFSPSTHLYSYIYRQIVCQSVYHVFILFTRQSQVSDHQVAI